MDSVAKKKTHIVHLKEILQKKHTAHIAKTAKGIMQKHIVALDCVNEGEHYIAL